MKPDATTIVVDQDGTIHAVTAAESDGSTAGPIMRLTAEGHAEQASTTGKNLLPIIATDTVRNGVTLIANADGSITLNGTATAVTSFSKSVALEAGTYVFSGSPANGDASTYRMDDTENAIDYGNGATFTLSESTTKNIRIRIASDYTCNNLTFYPQLELGSTATLYEPYTGGAPSPSPDYPQEIQTVTGHEVTGKTGRFVDLVVKQGDTTLSTTPIPLPSRGWVGSLPDGTADTLTLDGAGKVVWERATNETTQAVTDGVTGTVGVDVLSSTGQIADGATVLYKLATPVTEDMGYIDLPDIPEGASLSIAELDALNVRYIVDDAAAELARMWYERAYAELGDAIIELAGRVATLENA